jgi:hypothetical protein
MFNLALGIEASDNIYFTFSIVVIGGQSSNTWLDMFSVHLNNDVNNNLKTLQNSVRCSISNYYFASSTKFSTDINLNDATFFSYYSFAVQSNSVPIDLSFAATTFGSLDIQTAIQI